MQKWHCTLIHPSILQIHTAERPPNSHWVSILDWPLTMPLPIKLINGPGAVSMNNSFELRFPLIFGPAAEQPLMGLAVDGPLVADGQEPLAADGPLFFWWVSFGYIGSWPGLTMCSIDLSPHEWLSVFVWLAPLISARAHHLLILPLALH